MKENLKKFIVSILTIALVASIGTIVPAFASETTEPPAMFFDNTYADIWNKDRGNSVKEQLVVSDSTTATYGKNVRVSKGMVLATNNPVTYDATAYGYVFGDETPQTMDDTLVITLPEKDGYVLTSVGVRVGGVSGGDSMNLFDYSFSSDNSEYYQVEYRTSGSLGKMYNSGSEQQNAFNHTLKVPSNAKYLKIKLNSTYSTSGTDGDGAGTDFYVSVFGFTFAYTPMGDYDTLKVSATTGADLMNILSSGLLDEGSTNWVPLQDKVTTGKPYGINLTANTNSKFKAPDGWEFIAFEAGHTLYQGGSTRVVTVGLGTETDALTANTSNANVQGTISCNYPSGHNVLNFTGSTATTSGFTNINITMEKSALSTSVENSVINADNISVDVKVSDVFASDYSTMELIVAGYDGNTLAGVDIIPINKNDEETLEKGFKEVTASLPKNTTKVRTFLWKDLTTLVPILPATPEYPVAQ